MNIYLILEFCFLTLSVSANQLTVPVQQYPAYQQSLYNPAPVPVVYQAAATSYNNPCSLHNTVQTQTPNQLANALVSQVLTNPTIHRILDPVTRFYNQDAVEYQKQVYNSAPVPNIINNYFIVSPEYLKLNESELISQLTPTQLVNTAANHNAVDTIDVLTNIPQSNLATKESLVQASPEIPLSNVANNIPHRKVRRKKGKKRIRAKLIPPLNWVKDASSHVPTGPEHSEVAHNSEITKLTINKIENNNPHEKESSNYNKEVYDKKLITPEEIPIVTIKEENHSNIRKPKKKSKKRTHKSKSVSNTAGASTTEHTSTDNAEISQLASEAFLQDRNKNTKKDQTISKINDLSNDFFVQDLSLTELNEGCFADIGSLISCLDDAESRVTRNSKDEEILRDFRQKFPDVPEAVARSMLTYVQNQYQNQMKNNYYYPSNIPQGYNTLFQMPFMYNFGRNDAGEVKPKTKSRRRKTKHRKGKSKKRSGAKYKTTPNTVIESTTAKTDNPLIDITSTTKMLNLQIEEFPTMSTHQEATSTVTETLLPITEEISIDYDYSRNIEPEEINIGNEELDQGYHEDEIPALGEEDYVPLIYTNGLIDDYYPTFFDSAYYANNNEFTVADVSDRYYYTTDRNIDNGGRDRRKLEINFKETIPKLIKQTFRETKPKHTYFDADRESYKNLIKEVIQPKSLKSTATPKTKEDSFKTPPGLENPDFRTKKIDKNAFKSDDYKIEDSFDDVRTFLDYGEKSSMYSNAKTPLYNSRTKPSFESSFVLERPVISSGSDVETLYARSKVAKYGVEANNDNVSPEIYHDNHEEISVVTAKSLKHYDETW